MARTTPNRPVRLIRVQPNPVFLEPKYLAIKPLTHAPIEIERPPDYLTTCIHRADFNDIHPDILQDYAKHYDIQIEHEDVVRAEIMAILCMKNEWIPILPEHDATLSEDGSVQLSKIAEESVLEDGDADAGEASIPERLDAPEDDHDDIPGDFDFDHFLSTLSLGDLCRLTSCLQARHAQVQSKLRDANAATREAAANVLETMARLNKEKARMKKLMTIATELVGEHDEEVGDNESNDEEVDEEEVEALLPPALCTSCRVAEDLTVSHRHSVYRCAQHMPRSRKVDEGSGEGSQMLASAPSSSARNDNQEHAPLRLSSFGGDSTIIFGLTTKSASTSNSTSKGKKRALEESDVNVGSDSSSSSNKSPKRARVEESQVDIGEIQDHNSQQEPASSSAAQPHKALPRPAIRISDPNNPAQIANADREEEAAGKEPHNNATLGRTTSVSDPRDKVVNIEREEAIPRQNGALRRKFTINDFDDPEDVAAMKEKELSCVAESKQARASNSAAEPPKAPPRPTVCIGDPSDPAQMANAGRAVGREPHNNAPLDRTTSVSNSGDPKQVANIEREETIPRQNGTLRRKFTINDFDDPEDVAAMKEKELSCAAESKQGRASNSAAQSHKAPLRPTTGTSNLNDPAQTPTTERGEKVAEREPRKEEPLETSVSDPNDTKVANIKREEGTSASDLNDPKKVANIKREEASPRLGGNLRRQVPAQTANAEREEKAAERKLPKEEPLETSVSDLNDPKNVANIKKEEASPAPEGVAGGEVAATADGRISVGRWRNMPLRRSFVVGDLNDPVEVARAAMLTALWVESRPSQRSGVDVSRVTPPRRHPPATNQDAQAASGSQQATGSGSGSAASTPSGSSMPGKRARDSDDGDKGQGRAQKKTRVRKNSDGSR